MSDNEEQESEEEQEEEPEWASDAEPETETYSAPESEPEPEISEPQEPVDLNLPPDSEPEESEEAPAENFESENEFQENAADLTDEAEEFTEEGEEEGGTEEDNVISKGSDDDYGGDNESKPKSSVVSTTSSRAESDYGNDDEEDPTSDKPRSYGKGVVSTQAMAEQNRLRIARAKQEREERKSSLEVPHIYMIECAAELLELKPKEIEEFILDSQRYIDIMGSFLEKNGTKACFFAYQMADPPGWESGRPLQPGKKERIKRLMVSDGTDMAMKGVIMYFFRLTDKKVNPKTAADDIYFGTIEMPDPNLPGAVLDSVTGILGDILFQSLKINNTWSNMPDVEVANRIRHRFLTAIQHYIDFLKDAFDDISSRLDLKQVSNVDELYSKYLSTPEGVIQASKNPEIVAQVEHTVALWCKNIEKVLALSKQMRKETDDMGPLAELAYWRNLMAKMCFIMQQTTEWKFLSFIQVLVHAKSKVLKRWRDVDARVTDDYHEAKDNVRYMYALEQFCEPLYQNDPLGMIEHIPSMIYTIRIIHTTSRYYNTCEKVTALMVKISNQMIRGCLDYITNNGAETVWSQEKTVVIQKLKDCIKLYNTYRGEFEKTKTELEQDPEGRKFDFSVNHIFGRFEKLCNRLEKIIQLEEIFDMYTFVHQSHIDGIDQIAARLANLHKTLLKKTSDPLDFKDDGFDQDYVSIRASVDEIQKALETFMDSAIEDCPSPMHGLTLLKRFENLRNRCLDIQGKQWYLFQFYHNEIDLLRQVYDAEKNDTPIPRGYPPFAGKLAWAMHLYKRLERGMKKFETETEVLSKPEAKATIKNYNALAKKLVFYEILFHDAWLKQANAVYDSLEAPLLTIRGNIRQELVLNYDPFFRQLIEETELIRKMDLDIPDIAQIVYLRQSKLLDTYETLKSLLERFLATKSKIPPELLLLIRTTVKKVEKSFLPGTSAVNWTSSTTPDYFDFISTRLVELEAIVTKVSEVISLRINQILYDMSHTMMTDLPEDLPLECYDYLDRVRKYGAIVAKEIEYKSRACESAVIELINRLLSNCDLNVPEQILFSWMNPDLLMPSKGAGRRGTQISAILNTLPTQVKEELGAMHEECRHVFLFYSSKCLEALQKTTRISLDILRQRTEEPQVSKRRQKKNVNRVPLFTASMALEIPIIVLKPTLEEIQSVLTRSIQILLEILKHVVLWGQTRNLSFDINQQEAYYKDTPKLEPESETYEKLQTREQLVRHSIQIIELNTKLRNCYKPVMEYKDISKMVLMMQTAVTQSKAKINSLISKYTTTYSYLWSEDRDAEIQSFIETNPVITEVSAMWKSYEATEEEINGLPSFHRVGPLEIRMDELKYGLLVELTAWKNGLCRFVSEKYRQYAIELTKFIEEANKDLNTPLNDINDIRFVVDALQRIRSNYGDQQDNLTAIEEFYALLGSKGYKVPEEDSNRVDMLRLNHNKMSARADEVQQKINSLQEKNRNNLNASIAKFRTDLAKYVQNYSQNGPMVEGLAPQDASDRLVTFQDEFDELNERYLMCQAGEILFGMPESQYPEMEKLTKELQLLQKLYGLYNDVMRAVNSYYDIKWTDLDVQKIILELQEFQNRCRRLPKALKTWPAYLELKKKIDDFNETCPLLELMTNKAMKDRHWEKIGEIMNHVFEVHNENFSLKHVMEAPLLKYKDEVEDICIGATKEKEIEAKMKQIVMDFGTVALQFAAFKNRGDLLLKGNETNDIMTLLEDALMVLNNLFNNRYSALYKKELQAHLTDFSNTLQILENWLAVQNLWTYLEAVFVGGDIARQMPLEAKRFQNIDRTWIRIMTRARENPLVIPCCVGDETMAQTLPFLLEQLELCQKSLSGYLESKRKIFPRFYFVSDPVLLEILGQASDCHSVQPHLLSLFENVNEIEWNPKEYNKMMGVWSKEEEKVDFEEPILAEGNVETWLNNLLEVQRKYLHQVIRDAAYVVGSPDFNLLDFLDSYISQVGLLGLQIAWTSQAEKALKSAKRDKKAMTQANNKFTEWLNTLISQTTKNLSAQNRLKFETLITIHVHQKDIFEELFKGNAKSTQDFEWLKQLRFYFIFETDETLCKITDINFVYQNEMLGNTERLVITPLTDRCYITIAQAVGNSLGAAPAGPAGTGKTETTKDMAKALGKYCVVFNCSDQMDFRGLGRIFKGLAQSGSWGCFDEFNRIDLPVLSVAAQQIHIILTARREMKESFVFSDGDIVTMNREVGIVITFNPGYAGRQELPENLKVMFRSIAMIVPDRLAIIRVRMAAAGFLQNVPLSRKFFALYRLCEEQLSKQVHYDFGLRNILAVLRTLGFQKRARPNDSEETVMMAVLRDMNLSKLADEDEGLFNSLIKDLFPGTSLESVKHEDLQACIAEEVENAELVNHKAWNLKVIEFYEMSLVRHGLMALGPTGSGKTSIVGTLEKALTCMGEPHKEIRMNPKAITASQMFGRLDVATNDWTDGIFSTLWRKVHKVKKTEDVWIILDGPVDAIWIENLNSVLDDNKLLTLANGDRIPMATNSKIIFEADNVDNASPATVSRMGMVFMSSSILPWFCILESWMLKRPGPENNQLKKLFHSIFADTMEFVRISTEPKMFTLECMCIRQAVDILSGLLPGRDAIIPKDKSGKDNPAVEHQFLFALMWSAGALLELRDREKLQEFWLNHETKLDWPSPNFGDTIYEYFVNDEGDWEHWKEKVTAFEFPEEAVEYGSLLVPNVDNTRTNFLVNLITSQARGVLLIGEQGTAKTVMMKKYLTSFNPETQMSKTLNFSSVTTPNWFQRAIEGMVDKRMGTTYGPPRGRKLTVFIDDINMPDINEWGDQPCNEIVRQLIEMRGIYSLDKPGDFNTIEDVLIVAAMIHPGGGRNDAPNRLKRHFSIFNCTLPSNASMDLIFDQISAGYFTSEKFDAEIVETVSKLVPLTRVVWQGTKVKMLPTPAKFHYVFNLRDLSRIWEGMLKVTPRYCPDVETLMSLWKHECVRVISDRFVKQEDVDWFYKHFSNCVLEELGEEFESYLPPEPYWVNFMKDPDDLMEPGMSDDVEIPDFPNIYEPVLSMEDVQARLLVFQEQYNEQMRSKLDLVFFKDCIVHILRITRIIRTDAGCALLVGVGGSGKRSLTRLAAFLSGYLFYQIALTRVYNTANLMEDLKILFKTAGQKGRGVAFFFADNDIKDENFLEYINNVICSGEVANLIPKEEIDEICSDLIMPMKKEFPKRQPTTDVLYDYFMSRVRKNLHVVLAFSPVGQKFRSRALKFPGLVSGCTIDWFFKWPKDALIAVSRHFLEAFQIICKGETKAQLIDLMGNIHDQVAAICLEYFERYRRKTDVTATSFLSFLSSYKSIYRERRRHFEVLSKRMDSGLLKLQEAAVQVQALAVDLAVMEKHLAVSSAEAEKVLADVTVVAEAAQKVKDQVKNVKEQAEELVKVISTEKQKAEVQLEAAKPALMEAEAALRIIEPKDIATVRKLMKPPHMIMRILDCVLIYLYHKLDPYTVDPDKPCPKPSWGESIKVMMNAKFLEMVKELPLDSVTGEMCELIEPITRMEDFNFENAKKVSGNVAGLCSWAKALTSYYAVNKEVLPLKMGLAQAEMKLAKANKTLASAQTTLGVKEAELAEVMKIYEKAMSSRQVLLDDANRVKRKMKLASDLINGLAGERERWIEQSKTFKSQIVRLTGDVVLLAGFLSYCGPFNSEYRNTMIDSWRKEIKQRQIPCSADLNIEEMLVEGHTVGEWNLQGLPSDELSIQNGIIATKALKYPLLIDPQLQGKSWIKNLEKNNELQLTTLRHKYFRQHLEAALSGGLPLLVEDIGEELDPVLDNVLDKNFIRMGTNYKVMLGDQEIDVEPGFRMYMTTKLANPVYSPEICARTAVVDFAVTQKGLEDQLLGRVIKIEKEELENERTALVEAVTSNKRKMQELEENLLYKLSLVEGSLLDDESIVEVLNTTRETALDVKEKLIIAAETEKKINIAREEYRPIAVRGSILYFLICDMSLVNPMYQTSLTQFLELFDKSMESSEKTPLTQRRIRNIIEFLTYEIYRFISRSLYEEHKFMFVLLMALKIDMSKNVVKFSEFQVLAKGGAALDLNGVQRKPAPWILDTTWLNLVELSRQVPKFANLCSQIARNERSWKAWFEKASPEDETLPDGYDRSITPFEKLLVIRCWCPDRMINEAKKYIESSLGEEFTVPVILNLEQLHSESRPNVPICCLLTMGSDPTAQIEALAKRLRIPCKAISMGQGQEVHARALLDAFMAEGGWVLLQNCHLGLEFMSELNLKLVTAEEMHQNFRLWLTTEVHKSFSISMLQACIKFTNDPPEGVKAGLKRTYSSMNPDLLDYTNATQWRPLLYVISFLHSEVQGRRMFGPLGWNIPYEFNWADWLACVQFFQNHLDEIDPRKGVSWITIRYMVGEAHYGGRVTDPYDKRLLTTYCRHWFQEGMFADNFDLMAGYKVPKAKTLDEHMSYIEELPSKESPEVYGLHPNAGITYQTNQSKAMLDTVLSIQPKDASAAGGETREAVVFKIATTLLEKLPSLYVAHKIKDRISEMGGLTPMNIFLRQEIDRIQKVIKLVKSTLVDLRLAIEGTIILSEALRETLDSIYDAKVPQIWLRFSWQSPSIGFWFTELLERNAQFSQWLSKGRPNSFWMTGFFNAQGFLTAMKQEVTRSHKGWALDQVAMHSEILKQTKEELGSSSPSEGVYIHGLYLEGAGWDKNSSRLIEATPKILFTKLPILHMFASDNTKPKSCDLYECPIYTKPRRTQLNFVCPVWMKTTKPPDHWTYRGVAVLCDTK